ncbi:hypothetical protein J4442_04290 [Candidatus Woesearchaeota archaeon]|nr:hypothetical protein [Candidatus Woesearchaeota archaeon]
MSNKETFLGKNFHEKRGKKGQVTVFIIVGILIVIIAGGLIFVNRDKISFRGVTSTQVEPVKEYLRDCISERLDQSLLDIKSNGGLRGLTSPGQHPLNQYNALLNIYGINLAPSIQDLQNTINEDILQLLRANGCSLSGFNQFEISEDIDSIRVSTFVLDDEILVDVTYPITITRGDSVNNLDKFSIEKETDIGKVANLLTPLLNEVISARKDNSDFDFGSGLQYYCEIYGSGLSCVLLEWNIGGWRLIAVGDENLLENIGSLERGEVFTFLIAPKS